MLIEAFSDGSATTVDKPGGWAYVVCLDGNKILEGSGHVENATNNDMELLAAIQGLAAVLKWMNDIPHGLESNTPEGFEVVLCSDSMIVLGWADGSFRFKQESKMDKFKQLQFLMKRLNAKTKWIKGHSGHPQNERCDHLANMARNGIPEAVNSSPKELAQSAIGTKKQGVACFWFNDQLFVVDFLTKLVETYNRDAHGKRGSIIEIRDGKVR